MIKYKRYYDRNTKVRDSFVVEQRVVMQKDKKWITGVLLREAGPR